MKTFKSYGFLFFIFFSWNLIGQENFKNEGERIKYANKLFEEQKFIEAEPHMSNFLSNKNNSEYNFKYGVCVLFKYADKSKSIPYLKKAIKDPKVDPRAYFYLGRVYHYNYLFQDALNLYKKYKSIANSKQAKYLKLEMYIKMSQNGQSLMKNLSNIIVVDKKSTSVNKFNYSYDLKDIGGKILVTEEFQTKIDKKKNHKSIIYFPPLNQDILFYSSYGESGDNGLDIYFKKRLSSGGWSSPKILPENINSPYDEDFPFLSSNGTTFYFSSMGHNSMGGYDIYRCNFNPSTNNFGPISNLDYKINSTDDDILYLVDKDNKNAIFSSKRSSKGGMIDVYNVKVQVLPIQNIIISGSFKNSILAKDFNATIKVQDVRTNKLIGSYNVDNESNYNILLPNSGKYKFIVETPKSEKIHAGLVEVPPQTELKALKQEIELVKISGEEKLIIKDYFDQSPDNEAVIIANVLKEMSNPEINIHMYPDSVIDKIILDKEETLNSNEEITQQTIENEVLEVDKVLEVDEVLNLNEKSTGEKNQDQSIELEQKANDLLKIIEDKKLEKQTFQTQLSEEKLILNSNVNIVESSDQNLKINELESKIKKLESDIETKSFQYDELISEKKELEIQNDFVRTNNIDKNNPQLDSVVVTNDNKSENISKDSQELYDSNAINLDVIKNQKINENETSLSGITSSNNSTSNSLIEERKNIEFVENLPIDIPIAKDLPKITSQTVNGVTYNSTDEPVNFQVIAEVDQDVVFVQNNYENKTNNKIIEINKKSIDDINLMSFEIDELEQQKLDMNSDKEKAKVDKEISKINKKKAKTQLKIADDIAFVNDSEIKYLNREISSYINEFKESNVKENFKFKQAQEYKVAAKKLNKRSIELRDEADLENDKVKKARLIEEAIEFENTAINHLKKSKKLYSNAIEEDFSDDKLTVVKTLNPTILKQSERLQKLSDIALEESKVYSAKAAELSTNGDVLGANKYENLSIIQKNKSTDYLEKSLNIKKIEMDIVEDIEISKSLVYAEVIDIASSNEFKSFYDDQTSLNELEKENQKLKFKKDGYLKLYDQMVAKADALKQKSKVETDILVKKELISAYTNLKIEAKKNKKLSEAIVYSMDSVKTEIKIKQKSQALVLKMLDPSKKNQIKALAISGKADSVLALLSNMPLDDIELKDSSILNITNILEIDPIEDDEEIVQDFKLPEIKADLVSYDSEDIFSKDFVPPREISKEIFQLTEKEVYSKENPIPLNPRIPNGLIFTVQVGAFKNPIPQDLFKGFAPVSAEKLRDEITRYRVGYFITLQDANIAKNQVRALSVSYGDAFVVAFNNGEKIKLSEARSILSNQPAANIQFSSKSSTKSLSALRNEIARNPTLASAKTTDQINGIFYSVQIGAFSKPLLKENLPNVSPLIVSIVNNLYKYSTGEFKSIELAARKKAELLDNGVLTDAFIIAYNNGRNITLQKANSVNPDRVVEYNNPIIYYIDFGTYGSDIPENLDGNNLELRDFNIKSRSRFGGNQFFSKKYNSLEYAQIALNSISSDELINSRIIKSTRDDFALNYEYKIEVGEFDSLTDELKSKFNKLKDLEIKGVETNGLIKYYSKSRDNYESITTDLNACTSQNLKNSKILVFKDGVLTKMEETLNSFK
jgi:hypothetical protein